MKIKVKAVKRDGIVYAELAEIPDKVKFDMEKDKRYHVMSETKTSKVGHVHKEEEKTAEEKVEEKEKEKASVEAGFEHQKQAAHIAKHTSTGVHKKNTMPVRKALKK